MKSKEQYELALEVVGGVIREWDPYGLLAMGCPADEFDREIASVVTQIPRIKSANDAAHAISRVFSSSFERVGFAPEDCKQVGTSLFAALAARDLLD